MTKVTAVVNQEQLQRVLDWAQSLFPVSDHWEEDTLCICLPNHTKTQGIIKVTCEKFTWLVEVDKEFKEALDEAIKHGI